MLNPLNFQRFTRLSTLGKWSGLNARIATVSSPGFERACITERYEQKTWQFFGRNLTKKKLKNIPRFRRPIGTKSRATPTVGSWCANDTISTSKSALENSACKCEPLWDSSQIVSANDISTMSMHAISANSTICLTTVVSRGLSICSSIYIST